MYNEFAKEQFNRETIEIEGVGFIVFNIYDDNSCYIHILYVKPEYRGSAIGEELEKKVIEKYKPKVLYSYVDLSSNNPHISLRCILKAGYEIDIERTSADSIVLKKVLE